MKAIERFYQYLDTKNIKPTRFEKEIGLSNGYLGTQLKRNADLGEGVMIKIIDNCLELNPEWLLTGKGEMLKNDKIEEQEQISEDIFRKLITEKDKIIASLNQELGMLKERNSNFQRELEQSKSPTRLDELNNRLCDCTSIKPTSRVSDMPPQTKDQSNKLGSHCSTI